MPRINLVTMGTEGDVRPFVALGKALLERGHRVVLASHDDFEELARAHGLEFRSIGNSIKTLLSSERGRAWIDSSDRFFEYMRTVRIIARDSLAVNLAQAPSAIAGADAVIVHALATFAFHDAEKAGIPLAFATLIPVVDSAQLRPILFPGAPPWGWLRRGVGRFTLRALSTTVLDLHEGYRRQIGLPPIGSKNPIRHWAWNGVPYFHLLSEALVPRPSDWPPSATVTGFCELPEPLRPPPPGLEEFLAAGEPPVYVGFGSMTGSRAEAMGRTVLEALQRVGCRAVVTTGWGGLHGLAASQRLFVCERVDHHWLFPKVAAVVHHGGVGTLSAGLRAGRPTAVVAFFGDQPYWGEVTAGMGAGPRPLRRKDATAERLAALIKDVLTTPSYAPAAARIGAQLRAEDGAARTAEAVERWVLQRLKSRPAQPSTTALRVG